MTAESKTDGSVQGTEIVPATEQDLEWLHNGFDEGALRRNDDRYMERALTASATPKHWRPVDVERVG